MKKIAVTFGEILLRLSSPGHQRLTQATSFQAAYAGAEANVAVSLTNFGLPSRHITRFPDNDLGKAAVRQLQIFGVDASGVLFGDGRMGVYFLENGVMQRSSRIVYDRFDSAFARIKKGDVNWSEVLKDASWFHYTGITPAISQGAADACLEAVQAANKLGVPVSGDINYRRVLWQYGKSARDVMPSLISQTQIVVAGEVDLENCLGLTGSGFEDASSKAMKQYPGIRKIATTERESINSSHNKISAVLFDGKKALRSRAYDLTHIVDRIGAGDAFMAGLIYGLLSGRDDQQSLEFATAASAWKHGIEGDANLASIDEIESLLKGENVGRLLR